MAHNIEWFSDQEMAIAKAEPNEIPAVATVAVDILDILYSFTPLLPNNVVKDRTQYTIFMYSKHYITEPIHLY